jgi:hypothetical protein
LQNGQRYDLIVILGYATSEITTPVGGRTIDTHSDGRVARSDSTKGLFFALYGGHGSHFFVTTKAGEPVDKHYLTQVGRALKELDVQMIPAYSPQARRRSERYSGTWQGRLHQEPPTGGDQHFRRSLREHHMDVFTRKFAVTPEQKESACRRFGRSDLDWVSTPQTERMVAKDKTTAIGGRMWQLDNSRFPITLAGCTLTIHEDVDGSVSLRFGPRM